MWLENNMRFTCVTAAWRIEGLKSVINQIKRQEYDQSLIQHIIVNDNNEEIRKFLEENDYFKNDDNIQVVDLRVRTHYYGAFARSVGAMIAFSYIRERDRNKDEFVCFCDDDNIIYSNYLSTFAKMHEENPEATLLGVDMNIRNKRTDNLKTREMSIQHNRCDLGSFCYRRDVFDKYGYFVANPRNKQRFDYNLLKKIADGEGDKVYIKHGEPTWLFNKK